MARAKRCNVCASKLDKDGNCTWEGCPKCPKYKHTEVKEDKKNNRGNDAKE